MSDTDFSISAPTFVQFDYNGWPNEEKSLLESLTRALRGVTEVNQAGGRSSIHVHYDPATVDRDSVISSVKKIAEPILVRLQDAPRETGRLSDILFDGGVEISPSPVNREDSDVHHLAANELRTAPPGIGSSTLEVYDAATAATSSVPKVSSQEPVRSSTWTGNKPVAEQIDTIRMYAPLALAGLDELAAAIEDKRFNDEATQDALRILTELRAAIDELIKAAERGMPLTGLWKLVEHRTNDLIKAAMTGAKVIAGAPIVGLGAAYTISLLTGDAITGQMVATMAGGSLMAGAMAKADKKP